MALYVFGFSIVFGLLAGLLCAIGRHKQAAVPAVVMTGLAGLLVNWLILFFGQPAVTHWADDGWVILISVGFILVLLAVSAAIGAVDESWDKDWKPAEIAGALLAIYWVAMLLANLFFVPPVICSDSVYAMADLWQVQDATEAFHDADLSHLLRVSPEQAERKAKNAMPGNLGSYLEVGRPNLQLVNGHPYYIVALDIQVGQWVAFQNNGGVVPGYFVVDAFDKDVAAQFRSGYQMKYVNSPRMWYEFELDRYMYTEFALGNPLRYDDLGTLEVDDQWQPFYTATSLKHAIGHTGFTVEGTVVIDPQSGEITHHLISDTPVWIDIVWTRGVVEDYAYWWKNFAYGVLCSPFNATGRRNIDDIDDIFTGDGSLWYQVTFTSTGNDTSLTDIVYVNPKTGQTLRYDVSGQSFPTVQSVDDLIDGASQAINPAGFEPTDVEIQQIFGEFVYYAILNTRGEGEDEASGSYAGVAFVRAKDATEQTAVIIDSTLEGAYEQLRRAVANDRRDDPDLSEVIQQVQVSGVVQRASYWAEGGLYQFRVVDATGSEWLFQSAASNRAAAEVQAGDVVFVTAYQGNREDWLDVKSISYTAPAGFGGVTFDQANDEEIVDWFELLKREAEERGIFTPVPNGSE